MSNNRVENLLRVERFGEDLMEETVLAIGRGKRQRTVG